MAKTKKRVEKPVIRHMASLGSLAQYGGRKGEWSTEEKLQRIKRAGFDGFTGRVPIITREMVEKSGMLFAATSDIGGKGEIKPKFKAIKEVGARCVNVQMLDHDTQTKRAVDVARRVMAVADEVELTYPSRSIAILAPRLQRKLMPWPQGLKRRRNGLSR